MSTTPDHEAFWADETDYAAAERDGHYAEAVRLAFQQDAGSFALYTATMHDRKFNQDTKQEIITAFNEHNPKMARLLRYRWGLGAY